MRAVLRPFLALQSLTTRKPDAGMLEVATIALKRVLVDDGVLAAEPATAVATGETVPGVAG